MNKEQDTLEEKLKEKLRRGEISQQEYEELFSKFKALNILDTKKGQSFEKQEYTKSGSTILEGGKVDGPVSISGRAIVDGPLECLRLTISGSAKIDGDLTVLGKSIISGTIDVGGHAKFGDRIVASGEVSVDRNLYSTNKCSVSGRAEIHGNFVSDGPIIITGQLNSKHLKSTSSIKVEGKIKIEENLVAKEFEFLSGEGKVLGDLKAEMIRIFTRFRVIESDEKEELEIDEIEPGNISQMVSNVVNVFFPQLIKTVATGIFDPKPSMFKVDGNVEGNIIDISQTEIYGDIIGQSVSIGPEVQVGGTIYYKDFIEVPAGSNYNIKKLD